MAATVFGASTQKKGHSFPNPGELCSGSGLAQRPEDTSSYFITRYVKPQVSFQRSSFRLEVWAFPRRDSNPRHSQTLLFTQPFPRRHFQDHAISARRTKFKPSLAHPKMIILPTEKLANSRYLICPSHCFGMKCLHPFFIRAVPILCRKVAGTKTSFQM